MTSGSIRASATTNAVMWNLRMLEKRSRALRGGKPAPIPVVSANARPKNFASTTSKLAIRALPFGKSGKHGTGVSRKKNKPVRTDEIEAVVHRSLRTPKLDRSGGATVGSDRQTPRKGLGYLRTSSIYILRAQQRSKAGDS